MDRRCRRRSEPNSVRILHRERDVAQRCRKARRPQTHRFLDRALAVGIPPCNDLTREVLDLSVRSHASTVYVI